MKLILTSALCLAWAMSLASFDLMLIQEATPVGGLYRVHRVDPANGVSLGSFQIGPDSKGLAASQSRGEMYTMDVNGNLRTWDYSTGAMKSVRYVGTGLIQDFIISNDQSKVYFVNGSNLVYSYDLTTNGTGTIINQAGTQLTRLTQAGNGDIYACDIASGKLGRYNAASSYFLASTETYYGSTVDQMTYVSNVFPGYGAVYYGSDATAFGYNITAGGNFYAGTAYGFSVQYANTADAVTQSHNGAYLIGSDTSSSSNVRVAEIDRGGYIVRSNMLSGINGVKKVAIVLAPEPGTVAAIGLGIAALLKRRRK
ncbi:MAG: PEP-CTERM sorting domain-containing protein [Fimbriimonadaceae bacterium]|nr:PEP-CTERM sorting domain-containing protein [Fimbriimonadaceae bacterium]